MTTNKRANNGSCSKQKQWKLFQIEKFLSTTKNIIENDDFTDAKTVGELP